MSLTVVIPYRNERAALQRLLASLPPELPAIVVDDQSEIPPGPVTRANTRVIRPETRGYFSGAVNAGCAACDTDVLVMNQDIWFSDTSWVRDLQEHLKTYAFVGDGVMAHPAWPKGYVQGTFMAMRRDAISKLGGLDVRRWPLWGATADWQVRACRCGFKALPIGGLAWFQHERRRGSNFGASITQALEQEPEQKERFIRTPPLVSVIIPCHNYGQYLPDAIASLVGGKTILGPHPGQTFSGFEAIIVDDASTDKSGKVAESLADPWKAIRAIRRPTNGGTAATINTGIAAAFGKYFTILSADDMLEPDALEQLLTAMEANPHNLIYSDMRIFTGNKRGITWRMQDYDFEQLLLRNHVPAGIMAPRSAWKEVGGYPEAFRGGREDWAMAVALGRAGYCGIRLNAPNYLYRRNGQNRSMRNANERPLFVGQMRATFPDVYEGEKPMGCCGRRAAPAPKLVAQMKAQQILTGQAGMTLVEYIGRNVGRTMWYGAVTKQVYTFNASKKVGYVDTRDAQGLLATVYDRHPAFRLYAMAKPKPAPVAVAAVEPAVDHIAAEQMTPAEAVEVAEVETPTEAPAAEPIASVAEAVAECGPGCECGTPKRIRRSRKTEADA